MKLSQIKKMLLLGSGILLLGMVSCSKAAEEPAQEADSSIVVPAAHISLQAQLGDGTKASYADRILSWQEGDQLLVYSNGQVNGTLVCTGVDGSGKGTFSGEVTNFAPASVNVFFLGNRSVAADAHSLTVDFSAQTGAVMNLPSYILLKSTEVEYTEISAGTYAPAAPVDMDALVSILNLKLDYTGTPGAAGYKAKNVTINGLKNQITVNFADGTVSTGSINEGRTTVVPVKVGDYSLSYLMGVIPDESNKALTVKVGYQDDGVGTSFALWTGVDWSGMAVGRYYWTNWAGKNLVQPSAKNGYNGDAVTGGENTDGTNHKGGYSGSNADGSVDNPTGNKNGYNGTDVL